MLEKEILDATSLKIQHTSSAASLLRLQRATECSIINTRAAPELTALSKHGAESALPIALLQCRLHLLPSSPLSMPPSQGHTPGPMMGSTQAQSPPSKLQAGTLHSASHTPLEREVRGQLGEQEKLAWGPAAGRTTVAWGSKG